MWHVHVSAQRMYMYWGHVTCAFAGQAREPAVMTACERSVERATARVCPATHLGEKSVISCCVVMAAAWHMYHTSVSTRNYGGPGQTQGYEGRGFNSPLTKPMPDIVITTLLLPILPAAQHLKSHLSGQYA